MYSAVRHWLRHAWRLPWAALTTLAILVAQPLLATASTGWVDESRCCCASPADCHCPGHGGEDDEDRIRKCGNSGELTSPAIAMFPCPAIAAECAPTRDARTPLFGPVVGLRTQVLLEPETPPF